MYTETALFDLLLPGDSRSLKAKRSYLRPIIAMLRKFEVSVAEVRTSVFIRSNSI